MIHVDENDPVGEIELSFPYRDVPIKRGVDPKQYYSLESEIGRGKFGTVYKCKEITTGLSLAAKFIGCPKKEDKRNVEREVEIMRALQHPRLIQLYDAFENGKTMCVILELIEGGELFERVIDDDFILTEKSCTVFMRQICEGVAFIHKQNILHLDMKPENILCLTKTGNRIKIIDFGLARKYDPDKKLQVLFGTPEFVAPEVVNFDQIGFGTDMWSVGVICYVLLSGLSPFMGGTDIETMTNVTIAKYDFDDEAFQEISDNAKDFIKKLLLKDMNERMTADQCLNHVWLHRKPQTPASPMDVTKDNLRQFVERWNEHPNSPYIFEMTNSHMIARGGCNLSDSLPSLAGMSPSPCGSVVSSEEESCQINDNSNNNILKAPTLDHLRRASDSTCVVKNPDVAERINLAEEIRKLTDKLFQLSTMSINNVKIDTPPTNEIIVPVPTITTDITETPLKECHVTNSERQSPKSYIKNPGNCVLPKDHPLNVNCSIPWRRSSKHRVSNTSRDVPLAPPHATMENSRVFRLGGGNSDGDTDTARNSTKDLLLKLLEHWDGPQRPTRPNPRHGSFSNEWTENDTLGQRTISSLNTFFQSRAATKRITPFHNS